MFSDNTSDILTPGVSCFTLKGAFHGVNLSSCDVSIQNELSPGKKAGEGGGDIALIYPRVRLRNVKHMGEVTKLCHQSQNGRLAVRTLNLFSDSYVFALVVMRGVTIKEFSFEKLLVSCQFRLHFKYE